MGVPTSEVGYNSATARRGDHESSYEHVVALEGEKKNRIESNQKAKQQLISLRVRVMCGGRLHVF